LALFGQAQHPDNHTLAPLGLLQAATRAKRPQHPATRSRQRPALSGGVLSIKGKRSICSGYFPLGRALPKCPGWNVLLPSRAMAHLNVVLSLPSQQPSDGLFSPMEVRANHIPMCTGPLVPVRRVWSCTSKTTPSMGSSVLRIIAMSIIFHH
jgi:hypothetical protein